MHVDPVARAYSEALLAIARERGRVDAIGAEVSDIATLIRDHADVREFLETPALEPARKKRALESALSGQIDSLVLDFLCLLVDKQRIGAMGEIAAAYRILADEVAGRVRVQARSARPLPDDLRQRLSLLAQERLATECIVESSEDPELLGGLMLTVGDTLYDGSVRGQLRRLATEMMRSSGYEN
jgi:F-type H+-transporting ATPase subunit delta